MKHMKLSALILALISLPAYAQSKSKVNVSASCTDPTGMLLVSYLRDDIAASPRYELSSTSPLTLTIVCIDPSNDNNGMGTAAAVVLEIDTNGKRYLQHVMISTTGRNNAKHEADSLYSTLDMWLSQ